jgi:hypothetical protein
MTQQHPPKIIDKIRQRIEEKRPFFSFEFFPPKTEEGAVNLYIRFDRMATLGPVLYFQISFAIDCIDQCIVQSL